MKVTSLVIASLLTVSHGFAPLQPKSLARLTPTAPIDTTASFRQSAVSRTQLYQSSFSSDDSEPSFAVNPGFAAMWLGLVGWAFTVAPGSLGDPSDAALLARVMADPVHPGINELYYTAFNFFATIPVILAAVALPQGSKKGLPAAPFLMLSAFFGYFAAGPYLALRAPPRDALDPTQVSWFTKNVLENKLFSWFILAFTLYLPVAANLPTALADDPAGLWQGLVDLVTTSRFCAVSLVDLVILYISTVVLTRRDYALRKPLATAGEATQVALLSAVVPIVGSAVYCAVRPALPE